MNTTELYRTISAYMLARQKAREEYLNEAKRFAAAKGSQMYVDEMGKARKKREKTVSDAQFIARQEIRETLRAMAEKADKVKMQPPTEEQLRLLQMLKLKEKLTAAECDGAANAMEGNSTALAILDELADKSGVLHTSYATSSSVKNYDPKTARQAIKALGDACYKIVNDTTGASKSALLVKQWHQNVHGDTFDPDELPQVELYRDEDDFYRQMNIPLSAFSAAVD